MVLARCLCVFEHMCATFLLFEGLPTPTLPRPSIVKRSSLTACENLLPTPSHKTATRLSSFPPPPLRSGVDRLLELCLFFWGGHKKNKNAIQPCQIRQKGMDSLLACVGAYDGISCELMRLIYVCF